MWFPVALMAYGRSHIHDSFDQLSLLQPRHRFISALEFLARQPVAAFEWQQLNIFCHAISTPDCFCSRFGLHSGPPDGTTRSSSLIRLLLAFRRSTAPR